MNTHGRYSYYRIVDERNRTLLLKDDGYRFYVIMESDPARRELGRPMEEYETEWQFFMEYKHFNWPGIAGSVVKSLLNGMEKADISTIKTEFLE